MFSSLVDAWDERRARRGEKSKLGETFKIGSDLAFPQARSGLSLQEFCSRAEDAVADPRYYSAPEGYSPTFALDSGCLRFQSAVETDVPANNTASAIITERGASKRALVIFHHWNASSRQNFLATNFARLGFTVVEMSMPYHFTRSRPGASHADYMLSANIGRTLQSMRQAVLDGRTVVRWLSDQGFEEISVLGMSLGSWAAGLVAAHDDAVTKASLFLTADSLADMVWTGRATQAIHKGLETSLDIATLRRAWGPADLGCFTQGLARSSLGLQVVLARRDVVVLPELTRRLVARLRAAGADPAVKELACGHYSLALPPFGVLAGLSLKQFLGSGSGRLLT